MSWPLLLMALRLDNFTRPMWWGKLPGGFDGWTSDKAKAYRWPMDMPYVEARERHLPASFEDLHGRKHTIKSLGNGEVGWVRWDWRGDEQARLIPLDEV